MTKHFYNVHSSVPGVNRSINDAWEIESHAWRWHADGYGIATEFNTLTLKGFYVTGIILSHCRCITILLHGRHMAETTFYPAYGLFASAVELLGRCIRGNQGTGQTGSNLKLGLQWLVAPDLTRYESINDTDIVVRTRSYAYSVAELVYLRNFCAHGQASYDKATLTAKEHSNRPYDLRIKDASLKDFDYGILAGMPGLLGNGVQAWLTALTSNESLAQRLAQANVTPYRGRPVFDALSRFDAGLGTYPAAIGNEIRKMDWSYQPHTFQPRS